MREPVQSVSTVTGGEPPQSDAERGGREDGAKGRHDFAAPAETILCALFLAAKWTIWKAWL
ncbi:hypothetical protein GCM10011316_30060 [Roseibium aquae]|uniref:Uncharacterized protein n=1 Tax=Roseibium aquae TaxID=1323746 RepID=A0A916TLX9_9HYPH|nr:hypothetical protein [Roseibium aquae]GGB55958.1 hypothetical protein GCM10011316_30060 [Roseibium aquae]